MTTLITENSVWSNENLVAYNQEQEGEIRALFLGHKVEKVTDDHLLLDNGTVVKVVPNEGGCACSAGDYSLKALNGCDNIITRVEFETTAVTVDDGWGESDQAYRIFVVAEDKRINLVDIEGSDGNGYYGTGYELLVRIGEEKP